MYTDVTPKLVTKGENGVSYLRSGLRRECLQSLKWANLPVALSLIFGRIETGGARSCRRLFVTRKAGAKSGTTAY